MAWTEADIPDQSGRTVLVTGATAGLGLRTATALAGSGARVLMTARSAERGERALAEVHRAGGRAELVSLDLADLSSVRKAATEVRERTGDALDVLINNAGVMAPPLRRTADGFELQFGTNHLGHAALTWLLMPALRARPGARVVTVASMAARQGRLDLDDPNFHHRRYSAGGAYGQSKLANLVFALELDRRARAAGLDLVSAAAHPGYTATNLVTATARDRGGPLVARVADLVTRLTAQSVKRGALPQLYAATAPGVTGGSYVGPGWPGEVYGPPAPARLWPAARDEETAARLWTVTAELTGVAPDPA
ncbi:oxidoreductase [Gandjariella thermophila]|uniref:Short-chain dehydrogenase n=1 Tax=Gandjariella thermophila TaxID=1931992 RepID=A0A4D4J1B8_9PSEU|nr:oxidoreductase [Gandjariella thermophila]GDY30425.1 short-chain dehydrogenase [Gandjariella thermophila]